MGQSAVTNRTYRGYESPIQALRTSYLFLHRAHVIIPFLNDRLSLAKNAFVLAQFIAPRTFKMSDISVMIFYFSELVLYQ